MQVLILAAGKSTRLGALGATLPKPLVPICGYPPVEFVLSLCRAAGLRDIVVNLHHHADLLRTAIGDGSRFGVRVQFSFEDPDILGTGGAVVQARRLGLLSSSPVMILNGKVVADADLAALMIAHKDAPHSTVATMLLREDPRPDDWAPVLVDHRNRVVGLRGQRGPMTVIGDLRRLMFTGIHIIEPALFDSLPADGFSDLIGDAYLPALAAGAAINTVMLPGYFAEHSTPERYLAGNLAMLQTPSLLRHPPGPLVGIDPGALIDPQARLFPPLRVGSGAVIESGATVGPFAVVGAQARVAQNAHVTNAVVWSHAVAEGLVDNAVVTTRGVVQI